MAKLIPLVSLLFALLGQQFCHSAAVEVDSKTAGGKTCPHGFHFTVESDVTKESARFLESFEVNSVVDCLAHCHSHPFCLTVGMLKSSAGPRRICLISYTRRPCGGRNFTQLPADLDDVLLLLSCISCRSKPAESQRQSVPTGSRVSDGRCQFFRHPGIGVRHQPDSFFGPPTSIGLISWPPGMNESTCASHCWSRRPICSAAVLDVGGVFRPPGGAQQQPICYLLASPLQFFIQFQSELPQGAARMVTLSDIQCGANSTADRPSRCLYTSFRLKDLTAESFELRTADVLVASSLDHCASLCARQPADCILVVYESVEHLCHLIVDTDAANSVVGHKELLKRPERHRTIGPTERFYYVALQINCPQADTQLVLNGSACQYRTVDNVDTTGLLQFDPTPIGRFSRVDNEKSCAAVCFSESRCQAAVFSSPQRSSDLHVAYPWLSRPSGCVLFGSILNRLSSAPTTVLRRAERVELGATLIYDISSCDGTIRPPERCSSTVTPGRMAQTTPLWQGGEIGVVGPVFQPSECDLMCSETGECRSAVFFREENPPRRAFCAAFHSEFPDGFQPVSESAAHDDDVQLRHDIRCR